MAQYKDTVEDFNLKWSNTYVLINNKLVYIHHSFYTDEEKEELETNVKITTYDANNKPTTSVLLNFDLDSLTPLLFDSQFFNFSDLKTFDYTTKKSSNCLSLYRTSRRQNRRSISAENTQIFIPVFKMFRKEILLSYHMDLNYTIVNSLINQVFPTYLDALKFCEKNLAVAISSKFCVSMSTIDPNKYLLSSQWGFIGEADQTTLYIKHNGAYQEVMDFVKRSNLDLKVIKCPLI